MLSCDEKAELAIALCATSETLGYALSAKAAELMADDLGDYSVGDVASALRACRLELTGKLTLASILQRVQSADGRPDPNEAWALALAAADEADSVVLTDEIQLALGAASAVLKIGDKIGARMTFLSAYTRLVDAARRAVKPANWNLSMGTDPQRRLAAVEEAGRLGRLPAPRVREYTSQLTFQPVTAEGKAIVGLLTGEPAEVVTNEEIREKLRGIRELISKNTAIREKAAAARHLADRLAAAELLRTQKARIDEAMQEGGVSRG